MAAESKPTVVRRRGLLAQVAILGPALPLALWARCIVEASWANWVLPSAILLSGSALWIGCCLPCQAGHWLDDRGSPRTGHSLGPSIVGVSAVGVFAVLLIAAAWWWPASRTLGVAPSPVEVAALVVLVPLAEELYFRGAWLSLLRRHIGAIGATSLVSLVFGLMHHSQGQMLPMLVASSVLCVLTLWTRTLLWAVLLHGVWNALTTVVRMQPGEGRIAIAWIVTVVALVAVVWQLSRTARVSANA